MTELKKMLYIMNVDWNWIKQRPHFLAEELSNFYSVEVLYRHRYNRRLVQEHSIVSQIKSREYYLIPRIDRYPSMARVNDWVKQRTIEYYMKHSACDLIYVTAPDQYVPSMENFEGTIIYDCMDNHIEFAVSEDKISKLTHLENKLINRADLVLVTSEHLKKVLMDRYDVSPTKLVIERNAYSGGSNMSLTVTKAKQKGAQIAYFGTISSWFNFDFINRSLQDFPDLSYTFIGPLDGVKIPDNPRINYLGIVPHEQLKDAVGNADALMMPFLLNDITLAVDPVKLYEYLSMSKNIITVDYPEVQRFKPFCFMYYTYSEFCDAIRSATSGSLKYTEAEKNKFLDDNTWERRASDIYAHINGL